MVAEGVHFLPGDPPGTVAQKALRVNLSDLAAKGAKPVGYVLGAGFGATVDEGWIAGFAEGLRVDQAEFAVALLGGDTITLPGGSVFSITAFGTVPAGRMVHRFGGRPGDALYVSGTIGAATAGLALLQGRAGRWDALAAADRDALVRRYPGPSRGSRCAGAGGVASAAMDVPTAGRRLRQASPAFPGRAAHRRRARAAPRSLSDGRTRPARCCPRRRLRILAAIPPATSRFSRRGGRPDRRRPIGELREGAGLTDVRLPRPPAAATRAGLRTRAAAMTIEADAGAWGH
jgi:thiamine-monophosphate kinase